MKNLTITVDDSVLEWARIEAARRGASVSRMVGDFMAELQRREDAYERAYLAWRTDERSWRAQSAATAEPAAAVPTAVPAPLPRDATVFVDTSVLVLAGRLHQRELGRLLRRPQPRAADQRHGTFQFTAGRVRLSKAQQPH